MTYTDEAEAVLDALYPPDERAADLLAEAARVLARSSTIRSVNMREMCLYMAKRLREPA